MRLFSLYILALCFSLTACNSHTPEQETLATPEPRKVAGQYGGTIPCASCEGIVYNLELKEDSTYTSEMVYLGEDVRPYTEAGKYYYINEHVIALQKDTNLPSFIQVEEKRLRMLDGDTSLEAFAEARHARDAGLPAPNLLYPSLQVNIRGGRLPREDAHGRRHLTTPLRIEAPADGL